MSALFFLNMVSNKPLSLKTSKTPKKIPFEIDPDWRVSHERISMSQSLSMSSP